MVPLVVCIDGIIGAGKSTLMEKLAARYPSFPEPVSEWYMLENFYKDGKVYGLPFQLEVLLSQFRQSRRFPTEGLVVVERCPETSFRVFAPLVLQEREDLLIYELAWKKFNYPVDCFIYLDVDPKVAFRRIRNRSEVDATISLEYLKRLREQYLLVDFSTPPIIVDAERSLAEVEKEVIDIIDSFVKKKTFN